ncbi:MAG: 4-hydroxy-3-methylbut-2-enyl diphosphate reductase [Candidatus Omnitrophica bacterium]|nr:4-hydroxy-3-methylbut-2-enyl diphosphate reductase [Candidatus Omnitrophota bacterium]
MKINLAKSSGFCFGVKRALEIAHKTIRSQKNICMLGDIVHNEDVVREIRKAGINKINKLSKGSGKTLLIRAHGAALLTFQRARKLGYKIVDATCPMVKEIHKIACDLEKKGYRIVVIGDRRHDEVQGIVGQLKSKAIVIDNPRRIPVKKLKGIKKAAAVVQSTQNIENVAKIVQILKNQINEFKLANTICRPTRIKQEEIKIMPLKNKVMIIIGSRTSANTRRLYEISKALNKRSYWVQSRNELKRVWFRQVESVGVAAGASTPETTTKEVIRKIRRFC